MTQIESEVGRKNSELRLNRANFCQYRLFVSCLCVVCSVFDGIYLCIVPGAFGESRTAVRILDEQTSI